MAARSFDVALWLGTYGESIGPAAIVTDSDYFSKCLGATAYSGDHCWHLVPRRQPVFRAHSSGDESTDDKLSPRAGVVTCLLKTHGSELCQRSPRNGRCRELSWINAGGRTRGTRSPNHRKSWEWIVDDCQCTL